MNKCKYCHREMTEEILELKRKIKVQNALRMVAKTKANGTHAGGRKKIRNDEQIKFLRRKGLTIRAIAAEVGLSTGAVMKGLK